MIFKISPRETCLLCHGTMTTILRKTTHSQIYKDIYRFILNFVSAHCVSNAVLSRRDTKSLGNGHCGQGSHGRETRKSTIIARDKHFKRRILKSMESAQGCLERSRKHFQMRLISGLTFGQGGKGLKVMGRRLQGEENRKSTCAFFKFPLVKTKLYI